MMRRLWATPSAVYPRSSFLLALRSTSSSIPESIRADIARVTSNARQEAQSHAADLKDIAGAARSAAAQLQNVRQKHGKDLPDDSKVKAKLMTLAASLKTYSYRISNLETEAQGVLQDAEALLKQLKGGEDSSSGEPSSPNKTSSSSKRDDFELDQDFSVDSGHPAEAPKKPSSSAAKRDLGPPPPTPEDHLHQHPATAGSYAEAAVSGTGSNVTSSADGELNIDFLRSDEADSKKRSFSSSSSSTNANINPEEIEVEAPDPIDEKSITEITEELYSKGIDFSDCRDAKTLRKRYRDVLSGKYTKKEKAQPPPPPPPPPPPHSSAYPPPNSSSTGVMHDPHPGAARKMVDPMRLVGDLKLELARENNVSPMSIGMFVGGIRMDENKRMCDYPQAQHERVEIRPV